MRQAQVRNTIVDPPGWAPLLPVVEQRSLAHWGPPSMRCPTVAVVFLSLVPLIADAQHYRCSSGDRTYFSDRPCQRETKLQGYGPTDTIRHYTPSTSSLPKADDHLRYLTSECASIKEAVRTGPSRGVRGDVLRGLHEEYRQKCTLEDQDARARLQQDRDAERKTHMAKRDAAALEKRVSKDRSERCNGMRDVIALKRKREAGLNAKEVEALRSLERTYNEVCISG